MTERTTITWQWLAGIAMTILIMVGGAWMSSMSGEVGKVKEEQKADRQTVNDVKNKVGIIEERTKRTQEDVREIKDEQKETNKKLDELLRRRP